MTLTRDDFRRALERWLAYVAADGSKTCLAVSGLMTAFDAALAPLRSPVSEEILRDPDSIARIYDEALRSAINDGTEKEPCQAALMQVYAAGKREALRSSAAPQINQCDGCRRGLPVRDGIHIDQDGIAAMACTADRYAAPQGEPVPKRKPKIGPIDESLGIHDYDDGFAAGIEAAITTVPRCTHPDCEGDKHAFDGDGFGNCATEQIARRQIKAIRALLGTHHG